jgi:hypothetical protein
VKVYLENEYPQRHAINMPKQAKCHKKPKLFRIDGDIDVDEWIELLSLFFIDNAMIIEYFDPARFTQMFAETSEEE